MNNIALCIFIRTDLQSMNAGKAVAQGAHCATIFERDIVDITNPLLLEAYKDWQESTVQGFGTKYAFSVDKDSIKLLEELSIELDGMSNICHDPTYPVKDGKVTHYIPLDTGGYIFADFGKTKPLEFFKKKGISLMA
jgi:peptidyl-tRNA hydrolase